MIRIFFILAIISSCSKVEPRPSNELLITMANECRATVTLYKVEDGRQYLSDEYDCDYINVLRLNVEPGRYSIKAQTIRGKIFTKRFTKGVYSQCIDIEF